MLQVMGQDVIETVDHFATSHPLKTLKSHESFDLLKSSGIPLHVVSHHQCHAANAFFSSDHQRSVILTIDGGGVEDDKGTETASTVWRGRGNEIHHVKTFHSHQVNVGGLWTRVTRYVFGLQNGWPRGHQAGTVMAMAALGDPHRYIDDFRRMLREDLVPASHKPLGQPSGARISGKDPIHPYLDKWYRKGQESEQERFDMAASLQQATEEVVFELVEESLRSDPDADSLCISGGVALNSVMIGKIQRSFRGRISSVYVPPVPYDGGLCLGASQFVYHQKLGNPRIKWSDNFSPYLGEIYTNAVSVVDSTPDVVRESCDDLQLVDLLSQGKIVAVFNGGSESGRRALGNRSILADPRDPTMKDKINHKVKHRQWFRPFAPSILRSKVDDWFEEDVDSPYMTHVIFFKEIVRDRVPAVVHFDGSARVQTVSQKDNPWYHNLLSLWESKTGVPILLNSSANDTEPINENPKHMMDLLLRTEIDHVYFVQDKILVTRKEVS